MRDQIVAGNWKMNKDRDQALSLVAEIQQIMKETPSTNKVVIGAPFIYLAEIAGNTANTEGLFISAQNCHQHVSGAYTGEVSAQMLKSIAIDYVILGHSERREYFSESNELLAEKINAALEQGLRPIFCCGEPLSVRDAEEQEVYVNQQLTESLFHLSADSFKQLVIAYEPIWAIGTGRTASAEQAQEMHHSIRSHLSGKFGEEIANTIPILYGGSCKPSNAQEIFAGKDVDGGLIGGASLNSDDFMAIVRSL